MTETKLPLRVLLVEDDDALATMLLRVLRHDGQFVTHVRDGVEALEAFDREKPHVCLVDALLPRLTGFEVCKQIRARVSDKVGLIMMSATFRTAGPRNEALSDSGADGFLSKPFVLSDVRKRVRELAARVQEARKPASIAEWKEPPRTQPVSPMVPGPFEGAHNVARTVVDVARCRSSGFVKLEWEGSQLELAFVKGILVGARDNLRENQLGERLLREGRISHTQLKEVNERIAAGARVAEALVGIGVCDASTALDMIEGQVPDRLARALAWKRGTLGFIEDEDGARRAAVDSFDVLELILRFGLDPSREVHADAFVFARAHEVVTTTPDLVEALPLLQAMRPTSRLIAALVDHKGTVDQLAARAQNDARELFSLWLAGLVALGTDPPRPDRVIPRPLAPERSDRPVDRAAGERIADVLLRVRGRGPHAALGAPADERPAALLARLDALLREIGPDALRGRELGPRGAAAKELWSALDELRHLIEELPEASAPAPAASVARPPNLMPEQEFLDGQIALSLGDPAAAREAFERATNARPNDPDFNAWLAWSSLVSGDDQAFALDLLSTAARAFPQAMRPVFFLGLAAARRGDLAEAREHLTEAAERAPNDVEVNRTLADLGKPEALAPYGPAVPPG